VSLCVFSRSPIIDDYGSGLLRSNDLSTPKVDSLSDTDIAKIQAQLQSNNDYCTSRASFSKGMPASSLQRRARLATPAASSNTANATNPIGADSSRKQEEIVNKKVKKNQVL
jgi:hypothetical protein